MINGDIKGHTQIYAVIGDPIDHTFSPVIHNTAARLLGHNIAYVPFRVLPQNLGEAVNGAHAMGIAGINVTIPHKKNVVRFLRGVDETAERVGAVNTLLYTDSGYIGYNTDVAGLKKLFDGNKIISKGKRIAIVGAGGSAYAAVAMAASENASEIFLLNRTKEHAVSIAQHFKKYYNVKIEAFDLESASFLTPDIIIQTTSVGFGQYEGLSPVSDIRFFQKAEAAIDIIYKPWQTKFLEMAASAGCLCVNGFDMLIYQGLASYEIWNGLSLAPGFVQDLKTELCQYYLSL